VTDQDVVLITGTRKGLGRFLAEHFVRRGAIVEGCSREPPEWELENYTHHIVDVTNEGQVREMLASTRRRHNRLDIVVNNAGIASMNHTLLTPVAAVDRVMATNFRGTFLVCRESAKLMMTRQYGRIVNLGTVAVPMNLEGEAIYAASKSAIVTFTQILARELAQFGITCNVVGPTPIDTDLIRAVPGEKIDRIVDSMPIKRRGHFDDVANVIDFFVKPESNYITGQVIYLGGVS
jgi:3-oxoacyl-[acyl-carrier protein] reductase